MTLRTKTLTAVAALTIFATGYSLAQEADTTEQPTEAQQPASENGSTAEEPAAENATADEPAAEEPAAGEEATEEPAADAGEAEATAEEPEAEDATADEPAAEEPAAEGRSGRRTRSRCRGSGSCRRRTGG
ncbi:hypothetical protein [Paracoccus methylarcula]|uniref:hypothetical protein n=1 Tax=Paracoccus methylarcula TaxID=72022 RepID=UPI001473FE17|nr:hypothetical protein [Paracoccus methylarcula]